MSRSALCVARNYRCLSWAPGLQYLRGMFTSSRPGVLALAAFVVGCSGASNPPGPDGGSGGHGGGVVDSGPDLPPDGPADAAACDCHVENYTLTMSWACFCAKFGCADPLPACNSHRRTPRMRPGRRGFQRPLRTIPLRVGRKRRARRSRIWFGTSPYQCPSDPSIQGFSVRAGRFPDATCAEVACTCNGTAMSCPIPDAGVDAPSAAAGER